MGFVLSIPLCLIAADIGHAWWAAVFAFCGGSLGTHFTRDTLEDEEEDTDG